ncbi:MAG: ester cyclase [Gemmatimonadota bacterium]
MPLSDLIQTANRVLIAEGDLDRVADFFADGYRAHGTDRDLVGHDAIGSYLRMLRESFPDLTVDVEILVKGADRIAWQRRLQGTHAQAFMGFPASGRPVLWRDMVVSRVDGDRIQEEWVLTDQVERMMRARKG